MTSTFDAAFASWTFRPELAIALLTSALIYLRGWAKLYSRDSRRWPIGRPAAFLSGLATIYVALASPLETFASLLQQAHMAQHLLLMMAAPPLIWLGAPMFPILAGLPKEFRRYWIGPLFRLQSLRNLGATITHPVPAWLCFVTITWLWHLPVAYQTALANSWWHLAQHICFLLGGLLFWYPVVRPFPARPKWPRWMLIPYLIFADVQNTVLSALFTFSSQPFYPHYAEMPRLGGLSAIDDQAAAGVMMWVPGSLAFLLPVGWIGIGLMRKGTWERERRLRAELGNREWGVGSGDRAKNASVHSAWRLPSWPTIDLIRMPFIGTVMRWQATRRVAQAVALIILLAVIVDGFIGPQIAPMNLAGVVPWIHWRGLVVIGLLVAGNVFCYGCPFTLPRTIARRLFPAGRQWPKWLRSKWLAVLLMILFLWSYEVFSLWNAPWITAAIALAYFGGAILVDSLFRDGAFCKYVCPIGQFHFVHSMVSPLEVRVLTPVVCNSCSTHACIQGSSHQRGCEMQLFQPLKSGNLDCTFCLDCVRACPSDNVGLLPVIPTSSLWTDVPRSGIGRLSSRTDLAMLALVLTFGAIANAAGMVAPVVQWQETITDLLGLTSPLWATTVFYFAALVALPVTLVIAIASLSRWWGGINRSIIHVACRFAWTLIPLGFAMWMAHYCFHFFASFESIVPVTSRFAADIGWGVSASTDWSCACCRPTPDWLLKAELLMLNFGLLASWYAVWRVAKTIGDEHKTETFSRTFKTALPWTVLLSVMFITCVWILFQPMEMRGMFPEGSAS